MSNAPSTPPPVGGSLPPGQGTSGAGTGTSTGLDPRLGGLLAYLLGWVTGLVFLLVEKEHREVRFHAAQSLLVSVALIGVYLALSVVAMVPVVGLLALPGYLVVGLGGFGLWVYLLLQGYHLRHVRLPVIGAMAEQLAGR
jgi:uncharacterized membrane protein